MTPTKTLDLIPDTVQLHMGGDGLVHAFSMFGDAWCDSERQQWATDDVDRMEAYDRSQGDPAEDAKCPICWYVKEDHPNFDEQAFNDLAEELYDQ